MEIHHIFIYISVQIGLIVSMLALSIFFLCIDVHNFHHPDPLMYEKCMHRVVVDSFKGVPTQ